MADENLPSLFTEPVLVVNQKVKLIELTNEYKVFDQNGDADRVGRRRSARSTLKKAARLVSSLDQFMTHTYEIRDAQRTTGARVDAVRASS